MNRLILFGGLSAMVSLGSLGCAGNQPVERRVTRGLDATDRYLASADSPAPVSAGESAPARRIEDRPVALVAGAAVTWDDLRASLGEAAGGAALEEAALGRLLERECAAKGITIAAEQVERERELAVETLLAEGGAADREDAERLLGRVRTARGLGDARYGALLRRTAMLRALVQGDVRVSDGAVQQLYRLRFGEKYRARLIVTPTAAVASRAAERIKAGESFAAVAAEVSVDPSADRGGLIDPISPADETYPIVIRRAAEETPAGQVSRTLVLEGGFGLLLVESKIDAREPSGGLDAVRAELERGVRLRQERLLMNTLARRLLASADVQVLDRSVGWSWRNRTERAP